MKRVTFALITVLGAVAISYCPIWIKQFKQNPLPVGKYPFRKMEVSVDVLSIAEAKVKANPESYLDWGTLAGVYLSEARKQNDTSFIDKAEKAAKRSLKLLPVMNLGPKLILAEVAESRHEFKKSIKIASELVGSGKSEGLGTLVTSYLGKGDPKTAFNYAKQYTAKRPGLGSYTLRGLAHLAQGHDVEGEKDLVRAISLEDIGETSPSLWARALLARQYIKTGRYEAADALCQEILKVDTSYHLALKCRAEVRLKNQDLLASDSYYAEAFALSGEPPYALARAKIQDQLGNNEKAKELRAEAEKLIRTEFAEGPYGHGSELMKLLIDTPSLQNLREAVQVGEAEYKKRQDPETLYLLALAHKKTGNERRAAKLMEEIFSSGIQDPKYFGLASEIEEKLGSPAKALAYVERARQVNPRFSAE